MTENCRSKEKYKGEIGTCLALNVWIPWPGMWISLFPNTALTIFHFHFFPFLSFNYFLRYEIYFILFYVVHNFLIIIFQCHYKINFRHLILICFTLSSHYFVFIHKKKKKDNQYPMPYIIYIYIFIYLFINFTLVIF